MLHVSEPVDGGVGRCVAFLAGDQVRRGWRVAIASPVGVNAPLHEFLADEAREAGAEHLRWQARTPPGPATALEVIRLSRIVRRFDPDLVHLHSSAAGLAGRLALRGRVTTVFQPHGWSFLAATGAMHTVSLRWERLGARWCAALVCVSDGELALGERAGIRAPYRVIPNGVDVDAVPVASTIERSEARGRLGLADGPLVVCIGRLSRQKGQDVLLDAWPHIRGAVPDAQLAVVGDGPDRERLVERSPDEVRFPGAVQDVREWLSAADVVAVPSRWEGMSLTMLDAMARERAVVSTKVSGSELLAPDACVPVEDAGALATTIVARLVDPLLRKREGSANLDRVSTMSVDRTGNDVALLYEDVLGARAGAADQ